MLKRYSLLAMLAVALFALSGCYVSTYSSGTNYARATSSRVAYYGPHPVYDTYGSDDWCNVKGVHYHDYAPDSEDFFVRDSGRYVFVGDPTYYVSNVNFDTYYYMGPHPLPVGNNWCYINGPHRHHWAASGYYNYTRVGTVNYYTYYGERNSYYDPNHRHYDLHTYYSSYKPTRYVGGNRVSVGMSQPRPAYNDRYSSSVNRPSPNAVYVAPDASRPNYSNNGRPNYSNNNSYVRPSASVARPSTNVSRPSNTVVRPSTSTATVSRPSASSTVTRPSSNNSTVVRPSTSTATVSRPSASSTVTRPSASSTVSRPTSSNTVTRPSASTTVTRPSASTTVTRPSASTTVTRPSASTTVTRPTSSNTVTRPTSSNTVTRPTSSNTVNRPSASTTVTRPTSSNTVNRPTSSTTITRPTASNTVNRPTNNNTTRPSNSNNYDSSRVDAPVGKGQYINNSSSDDEDDNNGSSRNRRGGARRR